MCHIVWSILFFAGNCVRVASYEELVRCLTWGPETKPDPTFTELRFESVLPDVCSLCSLQGDFFRVHSVPPMCCMTSNTQWHIFAPHDSSMVCHASLRSTQKSRIRSVSLFSRLQLNQRRESPNGFEWTQDTWNKDIMPPGHTLRMRCLCLRWVWLIKTDFLQSSSLLNLCNLTWKTELTSIRWHWCIQHPVTCWIRMGIWIACAGLNRVHLPAKSWGRPGPYPIFVGMIPWS